MLKPAPLIVIASLCAPAGPVHAQGAHSSVQGRPTDSAGVPTSASPLIPDRRLPAPPWTEGPPGSEYYSSQPDRSGDEPSGRDIEGFGDPSEEQGRAAAGSRSPSSILPKDRTSIARDRIESPHER